MKKILFLGAICAGLFADALINPSELPQNVQDFIKTNYANIDITKAKQDLDSYEIKLNNGTELEFTKSGELKEIDAKVNSIPDTILPELTKAAKESQKDAKLVELEKELNGYKLKFSNNYKVYIDDKGIVTKTVLDD